MKIVHEQQLQLKMKFPVVYKMKVVFSFGDKTLMGDAFFPGGGE